MLGTMRAFATSLIEGFEEAGHALAWDRLPDGLRYVLAVVTLSAVGVVGWLVILGLVFALMGY